MKNNEQRETEDLNVQDKRTGEAKLNTLYSGKETGSRINMEMKTGLTLGPGRKGHGDMTDWVDEK